MTDVETLQKRIQELEKENEELKARVKQLELERNEALGRPKLRHATLDRPSGPKRSHGSGTKEGRVRSISLTQPAHYTTDSSEVDISQAPAVTFSTSHLSPSPKISVRSPSPSPSTPAFRASPQRELSLPNRENRGSRMGGVGLPIGGLNEAIQKRRHSVSVSSFSPLDMDLKKKLEEKYDPESEAQVRKWVKELLGEDLGLNICDSLKSGVILCNLINKLKPGAVKNISKAKTPFVAMENINAYLNACVALGLQGTDLFQTVDLFEAKNMTSVLVNLHTLGRFASKVPGYTGPVISGK